MKPVLQVIAGFFLVCAGVFGVIYEVHDIDEVKCGERVMEPAQRCAANSTNARLGAGKTYEAMRQEQIGNHNSIYNVAGVAGVVTGLVMIGIGGYRLRPKNGASTGAANAHHNPPSAPLTGPAPTGPAWPPSARGKDLSGRVELTLTECATGVVKPVTVESSVACDACMGGIFATAGQRARCGGAGTTPTWKTVNARIPVGVEAGRKLRLAGQGGPGVGGGENGDLYLQTEVLADPVFRRDGADLDHAPTRGPGWTADHPNPARRHDHRSGPPGQQTGHRDRGPRSRNTAHGRPRLGRLAHPY